jgi:hypothetical protein
MSILCTALLLMSIVPLDCDPIYLLLKVLSLTPTPGNVPSFLFLLFRLALISPLIYAVARSISFVMIWSILILEMLLHCIELSRKKVSVNWTSSFKSFQKHLHLYQMLNLIVFSYVGVFSTPFVIAIMSTGLLLEIASVFAIIRLQASWPMYGAFVILAILIPLLADAELPEAIRIFDNTEATLRKWKLKLTLVRGDKRYYLKKIASLRPCSMYAGLGDVIFFPLRKSTKTTYYALMIYYVINALITVPKSFTSSL